MYRYLEMMFPATVAYGPLPDISHTPTLVITPPCMIIKLVKECKWPEMLLDPMACAARNLMKPPFLDVHPNLGWYS